MANKPGINYSEIRAKLKTYDIIGFRGSDFVADGISNMEKKYVGENYITHVGMIIRACDLPGESPQYSADKIYILESTASGAEDNILAQFVGMVPSVIDNKGHFGVQLRDMDILILQYDMPEKSRLLWLPLKDSIPRPQANSATLQTILNKYIGVFYDGSPINLVAAINPKVRCLRDNCVFKTLRDLCCGCICGTKPSEWMFCSELVAQIYVDIGIFTIDINPSDVLPVDFLPRDSSTTMDADGKVPQIFDEPVKFHKNA
jgi:hypothetical protein